MLGRDVPAGLTALLADSLSARPALKVGAYQLMKTLKTDTSRTSDFLFLNIFIDHLSGNRKPTDFKCHCQV